MPTVDVLNVRGTTLTASSLPELEHLLRRGFAPVSGSVAAARAAFGANYDAPAALETYASDALKAALDAAIAAAGAGSGTGVNATDVGFDVVLLIGQSNMVGMGTDTTAPRLYPTDPRVWAWEASGVYASRLAPATALGLVHQGGAGPGVGPGHTFALEYVGQIPSNRRVLLVPAAYSGTSFSVAGGESGNVWDSDGTANLYTGAIAMARAALAAHANNRLTAILWHQGESAANLTGPQYAAKLDTLIAKARTDLAAPTVPFVVGGMVPEWVGTDTARNAIEAVLAATPNRVARTAYVKGPRAGYNAGGSGAEIHYSNIGASLLGRGYFSVLPYASGNTAPGTSAKLPAPAAVTGLAAGTPGEASIPLTWMPSADAYNYRVEHRAGTSGAWTEDVVTPATSFTVSALAASTAYQLRVTALGPGGDATPAQIAATTAASTAPVVTPFSDSFTGTTGASVTAGGWTVPNAPTYDVRYGAGVVNASGTANGNYLAVRDLGSANGTVAADVSGQANWVAGLILRYQDASNYLEARGEGIFSMVAGTSTKIAAATATYPMRLSVTLSGSTITAFADGVQFVTTTSTLFQSAKIHGIVLHGNGNPVVDNFAYTP